MWIHFRKIANFGAISKIEKYIKNQKSETFLNIQIYNFCRLSKNQYENFTNFVPPVKFSYWFSFNFYGFGIFYIFQIFCALAKSHSARFSIASREASGCQCFLNSRGSRIQALNRMFFIIFIIIAACKYIV